MTFSRILTIMGLVFLASCGSYDGKFKLPSFGGGDPGNNMDLLLLGTPISRGDFEIQNENLLAQIKKGGSVRVNGKTYNNVNTGFGSMLVRSLNGGLLDGKLDPKAVAASKSDPRCEQAKLDKVAFHENEENGELPDGFGLITDMKLKPVSSKNGKPLHWVGYIELCTWIKGGDDPKAYDEYFWHIDLVRDPNDAGDENTLQTHMHAHPDRLGQAMTPFDETFNPFPGTLDPSAVDDPDALLNNMNRWLFKIHGKRDAVVISNVWRNGTHVNPDVEPNVYTNDQNCFDLFLDDSQLDNLAQFGTLDLDNQFGYCLGRCDGLWMNTHAP